MAEGGGDENNTPSPFSSYLQNKNVKEIDNSDSGGEDSSVSAPPDLFNENIRNIERKSSTNNSNPVTNETPVRREENPFSFKHFLNRDVSLSNTPYQNKGARPKVYTNREHSSASNIHHIPPPLENTGRGSSLDEGRIASAEFPSALPDFVQDHLVIEQCYLGSDSTNNVEIDNLPDFTLNRPTENQRQWPESRVSDLTFDLTGTTNNAKGMRRSPRIGFPLDLPLIDNQDGMGSGSSTRSCPPSGEVAVSKSLPDFLSDGPIHSNLHTVQNNTDENLSNSTHRNEDIISENGRLREELENARRQLTEQNRRVENLERDIVLMQRKEQNYMQALAKSMEQVEGNLNKSNERAVLAESIAVKLKQENKKLAAELGDLRRENRMLRNQNGGAVGGPSTVPDSPSQVEIQQRSQRLAQELRGAVRTAEQSLRHLLGGLDSLRIVADSLENFHRIEEHRDQPSYLSDFEDEPGPAL